MDVRALSLKYIPQVSLYVHTNESLYFCLLIRQQFALIQKGSMEVRCWHVHATSTYNYEYGTVL